MQAFRMTIGQIGIRAFDPAGDIGDREKIENAIHAVRGNPPLPGIGYGLGNVIGRGRAIELRQGLEYGRTHFGPLLAGIFERGLRRQRQGLTLVQNMGVVMVRHG